MFCFIINLLLFYSFLCCYYFCLRLHLLISLSYSASLKFIIHSKVLLGKITKYAFCSKNMQAWYPNDSLIKIHRICWGFNIVCLKCFKSCICLKSHNYQKTFLILSLSREESIFLYGGIKFILCNLFSMLLKYPTPLLPIQI